MTFSVPLSTQEYNWGNGELFGQPGRMLKRIWGRGVIVCDRLAAHSGRGQDQLSLLHATPSGVKCRSLHERIGVEYRSLHEPGLNADAENQSLGLLGLGVCSTLRIVR